MRYLDVSRKGCKFPSREGEAQRPTLWRTLSRAEAESVCRSAAFLEEHFSAPGLTHRAMRAYQRLRRQAYGLARLGKDPVPVGGHFHGDSS